MCIAIALDPGAAVTRQEFDNSWMSNPDGGGLAYINSDERVVREHSMNRDTLWNMYQAARAKAPKSPMILHMRIGTHGGTHIDNCHPFKVDNRGDGETVFAHNGIIMSAIRFIKKDESDTVAFGREYLDYLPVDWLDNPAIVDLVEEYVDGSKLVFLTTEPILKDSLYVINEQDGVRDKRRGIWFSNRSYKRLSYSFGGWASQKWDPDGGIGGDWRNDWKKHTFSCTCSGCAIERRADEMLADKAAVEKDVMPEAYFPFGIDYAIGGMDIDDQLDLVNEAEQIGFCPQCFWRPCRCGDVCYMCTMDLDMCECGPVTGGKIDDKLTVGDLWFVDTKQVKKRIHEMTDGDIAQLTL